MDKTINDIKNEYIQTDLSLRKLSEKYGVGLTKLSTISRQEKWVELREQFRIKTDTKTINRASNTIAKRRVDILDAAGELLARWRSCLEKTPVDDVKGLKLLAATLKDIKECSMVNSKADEKEQKLRIKQIERDLKASEDGKAQIITVHMENCEDFAK